MEKMIAACGLDCAACEAYKATQANDSQALGEIAAKWSEQYKSEMTQARIMCDGCLADGGRNGCYSGMCSVRACVSRRGLSSCAVCKDFACDKIGEFMEMAPEAKESIEAIRARAGK